MRMSAAIPVIAAVVLAAMACPARADMLELKARFHYWSVYLRDRSGDKVCYAVAKPWRWKPAEAGDERGWLYVSIFASDGDEDQVSVTAGPALDTAQPAEAVIGGERFALQAHGRRAYARDGDTETALRRAIARGQGLKVEAVSQSGTPLEYIYSLRGSAAAIRRARRECK